MAYQTRGRDPLLDSRTQAAIEKRGKELLGLGLIALGVMAAMMIGSYSPDDPSWMIATDAPVENWLGRIGASLAQPLFMIVGWGAWLVPLVLLTWGVRMTAHVGEERAMGRLIFAPIAVAMASVYASTLAHTAEWSHSFGLGGLFGDTVLSMVLTVLPLGAGVGVKLMSLVAGLGMLALISYVLGFTSREIRVGWRFVLVGMVMTYEMVLRVLGRSAEVSLRAAKGVQLRAQDMIDARREQARVDRLRAEAEAVAERAVPEPTQAQRVAAVVRANPAMPVARAAAAPADYRAEQRMDSRPAAWSAPQSEHRAEPRLSGAPQMPVARAMPPALQQSGGFAAPVREPVAAAPASGGFLSRLPGLLHRNDPQPRTEPRRMPENELIELPDYADDVEPLDDDRIKARISDVIRARLLNPAPPLPRQEPRIEPPVTRSNSPRTLILPQAAEPEDYAPMVEAELPEDDALRGADEVWDDGVDAAMVAAPAFVRRNTPPLVAEQRHAPVPVAEPRKVVQHNTRKPVQPSQRAKSEAQPALPLEDRYATYEYPPLSLLTNPIEVERLHLSDDALEQNARMLEAVLDDYGVKGEIVSVRPGPVVTMYELEPAPGLKASRVIGLSDDIARSMSALSARVSTVPGRSVIGIELPNAVREKVVLREILSARDFGDSQMRLPLALGKDIAGQPIIANLAKMPHLLIAGTTGSGKSVAINTMILSLLYKLTPEECRLIMIDPKMLELSVYDGIPHLLSPVVTDPKKAVVALKWVVGEMEERYRKMSKTGVRNIEGYNGRVRDALSRGEMFERTVQTGFDDETGDPIFESDAFTPVVLPYIVVVVDEMADLMMVAGKEIEACIQRLAQMARASGIHLIMATQRPSVDVITGTIKANFPTRISFQVTSKIDSRTILGEQGAEQLLGMGDMLYMAGGSKITRIHGPFCSDEEVEEIVNFLKGFGPPDYLSGVADGPDEDREGDIDQVLGLGNGSETEDAMYDMAVQIVARDRKCSTSYIQRKLAIGYNKAARLVEQMEDQGVVTPANHVGKREILVPEVH